MDKELVPLSRFLSLVLRHRPEHIGLDLDSNGWADVDELLQKAAAHGTAIDRTLLERIVRENDKQRFALSPDGRRIRANQGHSVGIDLALTPVSPPPLLYHGTADRNLASIRANGLHSGERQHVHLSGDGVTATKVGSRHGTPVVLTIRAGRMEAEGYAFYRSDNGVWLTAHVPAQFIDFPGIG
jgi:putative RNA 2'-phosphotransferase